MKPVVLGGVTAGAFYILDSFAVAVLAGSGPVRTLQAIASGVLGPAAYKGGAAAAALGLGLNFFISTSLALTYFLASRRFTVLVQRPMLSGAAFGLTVWAIMHFVILPFTFGRPYHAPRMALLINQLGIHALGVGLPIAMFVTRSARVTSPR